MFFSRAIASFLFFFKTGVVVFCLLRPRCRFLLYVFYNQGCRCLYNCPRLELICELDMIVSVYYQPTMLWKLS